MTMRTRTLFISGLLILLALPVLTVQEVYGQAARKELVSQRIADAINSGKYYLQMSGLIQADDEGTAVQTMPVIRMAAKGGASMMRMAEYGMVSLNANGYSYRLDEKSKTYTPDAVSPGEPDSNLGKLSFKGQGTCLLNGAKYYYDRWRSSKGKDVTFYYNTAKVAALDLGMESGGMGVMSLLSFDTKVPEDMYFCLGPEWKLSTPGTADISQYVDTDNLNLEGMEGMEELPEGIDLKAMMSGKVDQKELVKKMLKEEDLPEGMTMDQLMGYMDQSGAGGTKKSLQGWQASQKQSKAAFILSMKSQGMTDAQVDHMVKEYYPDEKLVAEGIAAVEEQEARHAQIQNAPEPPRCSSPWHDASQGCELAAGSNLGAVTVTGSQASANLVYRDQFANPENQQAGLTLEVTDAGIWRAFDEIVEETKDMTQDQAVEHVMSYCNVMVTCAELGCVTGAIIERAVATCMVCPSAVAYNNTGLLFFYKNDTKTALKYYQQAEKMDAQNPTILVNIAECFFEAGDYAAARRYADRAVAEAPDFGLAFQLLTSINLAEGKPVKAAETLFKCSATYFSDITAAQFFSLKMALLSSKVKICDGFDYERLFHRIFSPANLELLTKATQAGFSKRNGQDIPARQKDLPWPVDNNKVWHTYMSIAARLKEIDAEQDALQDRNDELAKKHPAIYAYLAMGTRGYNQEMQNAENAVNSVKGLPMKIKLPEMPSVDAYGMASQMLRGSADGSYLLDTRQFWCLDLWRTYYEELYDFETGGWACLRTDPPKGPYPDALRQKEAREENMFDVLKPGLERLGKCLHPCDEAYTRCMDRAESELEEWECYVAKIRCYLPCNRAYVRNDYTDYWVNLLNIRKDYYTQSLKPVLEEYWLKMNAMTAYCEDVAVQEYILNEVSHYINWRWTSWMGDGKVAGEDIDREWAVKVLSLEKEIKEVESIISQLSIPPIPVIKKSGGTLKNYGEKERPNISIDIPTPFGKIGIARRNDQYSFFSDNSATGTTKVWNLTTGERSTMSTYESLADKPHSQDPKGYLKTVGAWAAKKGATDLVGAMAGTVGLNYLTKFIPVNQSESTRQRMRTVDSQGNTTDSGIVYRNSRTVGTEGFNVTMGRTQIRTGNSVRTRTHTGFSFGFVNITEEY